MSKDKYPSRFFAPNGGYFVYYSADLFHNAPSFKNLGIFYHSTRCTAYVSTVRRLISAHLRKGDTMVC